MNDSTPEKQPQRVPNSPNAKKEGNLLSVNSTELSAYNPRDTHPHSALKEHLPPIHRIPNEILLHIIHIYVQDSDCTVRDLSKMTLVCQRWRAIVEDASSLWGRIHAIEGLAAVQKGLRMAKGAALHITYMDRHCKMEQLPFFKATGERVSQWRSLVVKASEGEHCSAILETTVPPRLEKLHLSGGIHLWGRTPDEPLILFGGAAAPPSLKDVRLQQIPIAVTPLKLAGLTSLYFSNIHNLSTSDILQILSDSPTLETLTLASMKDLVPDTALKLTPGWTIQHPSLSRLSLRFLSAAFTHFFLSALAAPRLQKLHVECTMEGIPSSQLLNDNLVRLVPTLTSLISTASEIKVRIEGGGYVILAGGLRIQMHLVGNDLLHFQDSFEWLSNHLGERLRILPTHLLINNFRSDITHLEWFTSRVVVTELFLWCSSTEWDYPRSNGGMVRLLSHPSPSSSTSWFLPDVEVLISNVVGAHSNPEILEMIKRRHSANREQREGESGVPKKFKEIRLSWGDRSAEGLLRPDVELLKAVKTAGEGAEVYWEGKKWSSAGLEQ